MNCPRCPHHVRQGQIAGDRKSVVYHDRCALKIKSVAVNAIALHCEYIPFANDFKFTTCSVYLSTFKTSKQSNDVVPLSDIYSEPGTLTDMDLL